MQPMWLCIFSGRPFEDTFENSQRKKSNKCNQCDFASFLTGNLRTHLKTHSGEKLNKCDQCDFASSQETFENAQQRKVKQMQPITRWPVPNKALPCLSHVAWFKQCNPVYLWKPRYLGFTSLHCLNHFASTNRNPCLTKVPGLTRFWLVLVFWTF